VVISIDVLRPLYGSSDTFLLRKEVRELQRFIELVHMWFLDTTSYGIRSTRIKILSGSLAFSDSNQVARQGMPEYQRFSAPTESSGGTMLKTCVSGRTREEVKKKQYVRFPTSVSLIVSLSVVGHREVLSSCSQTLKWIIGWWCFNTAYCCCMSQFLPFYSNLFVSVQ
jgi:hypothetical protein